MNKQNKRKLLKLLNDMALVMGDVEQEENAVLYMDRYILSIGNHQCGTAACVLGYYAMSNSDTDNITFLAEKAQDLGMYLDVLCEDVLGSVSLVGSIWYGPYKSRKNAAIESKLLTEEELNSRHLNSDKPTAKDARKHIELCISKIESYNMDSKDKNYG